MFPNANNTGMSLRDYFAAAAMQSITPILIEIDTHAGAPRASGMSSLAQHVHATFNDNDEETLHGAARWCYDAADAMLAARNDNGGAQ
jgi:hypothetical protein